MRIWRALALCVILAGAWGVACASRPPLRRPVPVMGPALVTADVLAEWYRVSARTVYRASVSIETLAQYYIDEGSAEGVRGDLAFVQAVLETGWFGFGGRVPPSYNNFAGLGAGDRMTPERFPDARTGVRAQIQHLRAYADPHATACAVPPLRHPCVNPRFELVSPRGRAPTWQQMGRGNWAMDPHYGAKVLTLYNQLLGHAGLPPL